MREIGAAVDAVQPDARDEQPFAGIGIDQGQALDGRDLAQQAQRIHPSPFAALVRPGQLHRPAELVADAVDEVLDLQRCESRLGVQDVVQARALVVVAEPRLAAAGDQQRRHDRSEDRAEVFPEERGARANRSDVVLFPWCRGRRHSMIRSALVRSEVGKAMPSAVAAFRLMNSSTLVTRCTGRSAGFSPLRMRPACRPVWRCDWLKSPP